MRQADAGGRPYSGGISAEGDGRSVGYAAFLRKADGYGWKMKQKTINGFLKAMKVNKVMKRWIWAMVAVFVVLFSIDVCAQENERGVRFGGGADVVSGYIWRGVWEAGPCFQSTLVLSSVLFPATAWGSVDFASTSYKEMDLTLAYALGPVTVSLADLYWEGSAADRNTIGRRYFHFGADSPHRVELGVSWCISQKVPLTLAWNTVLFGAADVNSKGNRAYATYVELSYPFAVKGVDMKAGIGIVPWNAYGTYGIDRDFYVQNVFLNAGKSWTVAGSLQLGLFTSLSWNPALEDVNFVGGISLRM